MPTPAPELAKPNAFLDRPQGFQPLPLEARAAAGGPNPQAEYNRQATRDAAGELDIAALDARLERHAADEGKDRLFAYYARLPREQKVAALARMLGKSVAEIQGSTARSVKREMKSRLTGHVRWEALAPAVRAVADGGEVAPDHGSSGPVGKAGHAQKAAAAGSGAVGPVADELEAQGVIGEARASSAALEGGAAAGSAAVVGGAVTALEAHRDAAGGNASTRREMGLKAAGGVSDMGTGAARTASKAIEIQKAAHASAGAATAAAGGLTVAAGAFYLGQGAYGVRKHHRQAKQVAGVAAKHEKSGDPALGKAADLGASAETKKRNASAGTALKGACMVAGGATLLALATNPAGWALLGAAAAVGLATTIYRMQGNRNARIAAVEAELGLNDMESPNYVPGQYRVRAQHRDNLLQARGFNGVDDMWTTLVHGLATHVHQTLSAGPAAPDFEDTRAFVDGLGLRVAMDDGGGPPVVPTVAQIAKRLSA